jgi:fructokinase
MKTYDVVALGELLIDFTQNGQSEQGNGLFEANPGGAPCNVLSMLNNLGKKTAFIGKVGKDQFGEQLKESLEELGIGTDNLLMDEQVHTTLALVHTFADGDRDFSFYRNPGADMMLRADELQEELLKDTRLFHFGTLSMTHEGVRAATKKAVEIAKEYGALISFDPNLREPLWDSLDNAKEQIRWGLTKCDILKISDNEIQWLTGEEDFTEGVRRIREEFPIPLILVSMGSEGSRAYYKEGYVECAPFIQKKTIETTGAGDTFCACVLNYVLDHGLQDISDAKLLEMLTFANAAASIITTKKGALRVMPTRQEVLNFLTTQRSKQKKEDKFMEILDKVNAIAKTAASKTGEMLEDTKLRTQILNDEKSIRELELKIGAHYYKKFAAGEAVDDEISELFTAISVHLANIEEKKASIGNTKPTIPTKEEPLE